MNLLKEQMTENDNQDLVLSTMENAQLVPLEKADPAIQAEAEKVLKEISRLSVEILEIRKSIQKRSEDLKNKEDSFTKCNDEKINNVKNSINCEKN